MDAEYVQRPSALKKRGFSECIMITKEGKDLNEATQNLAQVMGKPSQGYLYQHYEAEMWISFVSSISQW